MLRFAIYLLFAFHQLAGCYEVDRDILQSIMEGEELIVEIMAIYSNPNVSDSSKKLLEEKVDEVINEASGFKVDQQRKIINKPASSERYTKPKNPNNNLEAGMYSSQLRNYRDQREFMMFSWEDIGVVEKISVQCCRVIVPPLIRERRTIMSYPFTRYSSSKHSVRCGWWGWGRCTYRYAVSRRVTLYRTDISYYSVPQACPADQKSCCRGYFQFKGVCVEIAKLRVILRQTL